MNLGVFEIHIPHTLVGRGAVESVGRLAKELGTRKALIITDKGVAEAGLLDKVEQPLEAEGIGVAIFDGVLPDNDLRLVEKSARAAEENGCDLIIGVGGGSVIDNAKLASILASAEDIAKEDMHQYIGTNRITRRGLPTIFIPTTSGTGAEWTRPSIITDEGVKKAIRSPYLLPEAAIVDPLMTLNLPQKVTADTGMDALSHAVEGWTGAAANPFTDMVCGTAIKLIAKNLRGAYAKGSNNIEARYDVALASMISTNAATIARPGLIHAMAHMVQTKVHTTHGITISIMMCPVMEFNMVANLEKYAQIAGLMGEHVDGLSLREQALRGIEAIRQLSVDIGMPQRMRDIGVKKEDIASLVDLVFENQAVLVQNNARKCSREDVERIYQAAW